MTLGMLTLQMSEKCQKNVTKTPLAKQKRKLLPQRGIVDSQVGRDPTDPKPGLVVTVRFRFGSDALIIGDKFRYLLQHG